MTASLALPIFLFGLLAGWTLRQLIASNFGLTPDGLLGSVVTIAVGWWIGRAVHRQGELDRVPVESLSRLCLRIEGLILQALNPSADKSARVLTLKLLSNEIKWLMSSAYSLGIPATEIDVIFGRYVDLKRHLTFEEPVAYSAASKAGRALLNACLITQWQICQRLLDSPDSITNLNTE